MEGSIIEDKDRNCYRASISIGKDLQTGKYKKLTFRSKDKKECENWLIEQNYKKQNKQFNMKQNNVIFSDWFNYYAETHIRLKNLSEATRKDYDSVYKNYLYLLGDKKVRQITVADVHNIYNSVLEVKGAKQVKKVHRILSVFLRAAYKQQIMERNIMDFVELPTTEKYIPNVITTEHFNLILKNANKYGIELFVVVCAGLGLRRSEALGIQLDKIDFEKGTLKIDQQLTIENGARVITTRLKNETSRREIIIPKQILEYLKEYVTKELPEHIRLYEKYTGKKYQNNNMLICNDDGLPMSRTTVGTRWRKMIRKLGLPNYRIHDLRHYNATLMLKNGVPSKVARDRLGHSTLEMTNRYQHTTEEIDKLSADKIEIF